MPRIWICINATPEKPVPENPENDALDFCAKCWPPHEDELLALGYTSFVIQQALPPQSAPEEARDHPPYAETSYKCEACGTPLTNQDD